MNTLSAFVSRLSAVVLQAVLFLAGLVFVASLVAVALFVALVAIAGSLLRGRKRVLQAGFTGDPRAAWMRFRPAEAGRPNAKPAGEVIDIEVREVKPALDAAAPTPHRG